MWETREVEALQAAFYPDASVLSRDPPRATPARVLGALPGQRGRNRGRADPPVLPRPGPRRHRNIPALRLCGDHEPPEEHRLSRWTGSFVRARARPSGTPGGLVVLAACVSDLAASDYDEALTLASAFLTAGAVTVVGTRWQVPDVRTAIMMFMFHHYLNAGFPPAAALGRAQVWMLTGGQDIPETMPPMLADEVPRSDLRALVAWAGFTHQGQ